MKAATSLFVLFLAISLVFPAQMDYKSPLASVETFLNGTGIPSFTSIFGMLNISDNDTASVVKQVINTSGGVASNPSDLVGIAGALGSGNLSGVAGAAGLALPKVPTITIPLSQLRMLAIIAVILFYVFAAGKIADFLQTTGRKITKREALFAPFALMFVSLVFVGFYFMSGAYRPPQDTLITNIVYLVLIPAGITLGVGSFVLYGFFHDRLNFLQSLDLSIHIVLSPIFDGIKGYWTALGAAVILGLISAVVFYSTGGRLALATFDFLLLSVIVSLYYLYRMLTAPGNEAKAGNAVTILCLLAPSIMQRYLKDAVCAILVRLPFGIFQTCPLDSVGSEVTLMASVGATMLLLVPVVPILYAFTVNLLRAITLARLLLTPEQGQGSATDGARGILAGLSGKISSSFKGKSPDSHGETLRKKVFEKEETPETGAEAKSADEGSIEEYERESEEIAKKYRGSRPSLIYEDDAKPEESKPEQPKAEQEDGQMKAEPKSEPQKPKKKGKKKK
ncbi:MAG: hypothetical protein WCT52_02325 [Candidatus Micrarchaeia archaeon]